MKKLIICAILIFGFTNLNALPSGHDLSSAGDTTVVTDGDIMTVTQDENYDKAIITWNSFNLEEGEKIIFSVGPELNNENKYVNLGFDELLSVAMAADVFVCMESGFPSSFIKLLKSHSTTKQSQDYVANLY